MFIAALFTPKQHKCLLTDEQINKLGTSTQWNTYSKMMNTSHEFQMYYQEKKTIAIDYLQNGILNDSIYLMYQKRQKYRKREIILIPASYDDKDEAS